MGGARTSLAPPIFGWLLNVLDAPIMRFSCRQFS
jgi:hypothetical protein